MEAWTQFFVRSGIPNAVAKNYAKSFVTNRITKEMLSELDKTTLAELGVTAIGDQILILKRIKAAKNALLAVEDDEEEEVVEVEKPAKARITGPNAVSASASDHRRGKPPPDRHEIYHIKMPVGNTARTQKILEKAENMKKLGLAVRGTGVRQGGRSVSPIDKTSLAARIVKKQAPEVSSSTDRRMQRISVQSIHSSEKSNNGTRIQKVSNSRIQKISHNPSTGRMVFSRAASNSSSSEIRIDMPENDRRGRFSGRMERNKPIVVTTGRQTDRSRNGKIYVGTRPTRHYDNHRDRDEDMIADNDDDNAITVGYDDYDEEMADDYEGDGEVLQVPASSIHQRISYTKSSLSSSNPHRHRPSVSSRLSAPAATVIEQSDSIFSRVSYHRK